MQWKCYELVVHGKTRAEKYNKILQLQYNETTIKVLFDYLRPKLKRFVLHNYVFKFQKEQYNICLNTFPPNSILSIVDFAENYSLQDFNEVQEMHWHSFQITIQVHICYHWSLAFLADPTSAQKKS
jgi:hypothetical protein